MFRVARQQPDSWNESAGCIESHRLVWCSRPRMWAAEEVGP
jgi:hypothetical protein